MRKSNKKPSPLLLEILKREKNIKKYRLKKLWLGFEQVML